MTCYSNVSLPAKPEYDILSYPFAVAVFSYPVGAQDWYGLDSWMHGFLQGMNQQPFRAVQTGVPEFEPRYRYNELVLPGLPSLITSQEYVVIGWVPSQSCYRVWAGPNICNGYHNQTLVSSASIALTFYVADYGADGCWSEPRSQRVSNNSSITGYAVEPVWCNRDLIEVNTGTVILEGSVPESVVRMDPDVKYDPAIWSLGWYLGQWIAKRSSAGEVGA